MTLDWPNILIGLLTGVVLSGVAAWAAYVAQRHGDRRRKLEEGRFEVYIALLELYGSYSWLATLQVNSEDKIDSDLRYAVFTKAWRVADKLRATDDFEELPDVLRVLFSEEFRTAHDRARLMDDVIGRIGRLVNPRYSTALRAISDANVQKIASGQVNARHSEAPARMH